MAYQHEPDLALGLVVAASLCGPSSTLQEVAEGLGFCVVDGPWTELYGSVITLARGMSPRARESALALMVARAAAHWARGSAVTDESVIAASLLALLRSPSAAASACCSA